MIDVERISQSLVAAGATWVLWCLLGLSVLALSVILERSLFFMTTRVDEPKLVRELNEALRAGLQRSRAMGFSNAESIEARIVAAGIEACHPAEAEELMAAEIFRQRERAERSLSFLGTLGNNAPFVGLLGTVIGIIGAFAQLDASGGQLTTGLMAEIGEALIATAIGLLVALPAVAAYNAFQRTVSLRLSRGEALGRKIVAALHVSFVVDDASVRRANSDVRGAIGAAE